MNTDTQVLDQKPVFAPVSGGVTGPQGSLNKEKTPIGTNLSEFVRPAGPEISPNLPQEVSESGVEVKTDKPNLTLEHQELGMEHAGPNITVLTQPSAPIKLPMSEEEITNKLKTGQDDDSGKWQAGLIQKIIKAMGF
ncbi:MAG: hypothetical protein A3B47_00700 [Candidatus Levybacteria bacterium RIFCSPLOWO2_01_FULL_39_24]|nr:MAG: hypothetical protein A2800_04400 [Candidatus Levybacteria bacterium RIFCSPHIGHO2_01_FULL_40_16]OGH27991.1 MAG: hypothetical protein A3E12_02785 [Candidatus Levybacteria bacterium RIFCSPHIGHO2_12_FULL_39_9]OGH46390.1 MAG: hypothetical protein A3B47_00700 [Candidatus Levybacteria bacterium RIFCSPLOWO2_01_FULL_39_24]